MLIKTDAWRVTYINSTHNHYPRFYKRQTPLKVEDWSERDLFKTKEVFSHALNSQILDFVQKQWFTRGWSERQVYEDLSRHRFVPRKELGQFLN
jgi:hypothetical protein